jgi:uncharacterized protein
MKIEYPIKIPVFPLSGVIYFPKTNLPLNIFEQRYLDLVSDVMKKDKLMGMVQSKRNDDGVYTVGCLGEIVDFKKNDDGRILINLNGLTRFEILKEVNNKKLYREFEVNYKKFDTDLNVFQDNIEKSQLDFFTDKVKQFFKKNQILLNWREFEKLDQVQQINTLAMISPISNEEKQKLLETISVHEKTKTLINIIEFYLHDRNDGKNTVQ